MNKTHSTGRVAGIVCAAAAMIASLVSAAALAQPPRPGAANHGSAVLKFSPEGELLMTLGTPGEVGPIQGMTKFVPRLRP